MHNIVATEGLVLGKRGVGEANVLVALLTKKLGLVRASAKSARLAKSKLRYGLEPLTMGRFSLVRGKWEWKVTGAAAAARPAAGRAALPAMGRVSRLLLRLVNGEEANPELYRTVVEGFNCLSANLPSERSSVLLARPHSMSGQGEARPFRLEGSPSEEYVEIVLVLRILAHLGYLPNTQELAPFLEADFFSLEMAAAAARSKAMLVRAINESLGATGL